MYKLALLFLEKGADTNVRSADGWTPLLCATRHNATELAKRLLDAKADHTVTISFLSDTWTPLLFAAKNGNADIVFALLEKGHSCKDALGTGATALHLAIEPHNLILVRKLAQLIDPNSCDKDGSTALHSACMYGMVDIIKVLMKRGAKINAKDKAGKTPLHVAVSAKKDEAVLHLLTYTDIRVNERDNWDCTPLHHTAEHNDKKIARMLLNERASGYM